MTAPEPVSSSLVKPVSSAVNYVTLGTFSWDQDNEKVKVNKSRLNFCSNFTSSFFCMFIVMTNEVIFLLHCIFVDVHIFGRC